MKVLVCANQKGGATKTSTAAHLAAGAALRGKRTALVDLDGQCNLTELFGFSPEELTRQGKFSVLDLILGKKSADQVLIDLPGRFGGNLFLIAGNPSVSNAGPTIELEIAKQSLEQGFSTLAAEERKDAVRMNLRTALQALDESFDLVVIDPPPSLGFELTVALAAADAYVVPMTPNKFDLSGFKKLEETVRLTKKRYNAELDFLGIVVGRVRDNTKLHKETLQQLESRFGSKFLKPFIRESIRFGECPYHGQTIYELVPDDAPANDYAALTDAMLARLLRSTAAAPAPEHVRPDAATEERRLVVGEG
ncbi:MAG: ParA family protein [Myxococcales bacterium]|nr:ParA family protein [Myxococcales bacterium]